MSDLDTLTAGWTKKTPEPGSLEASFAGPLGGGAYSFYDTGSKTVAVVRNENGSSLSEWFGGAAPEGTPQYWFNTDGNLSEVVQYHKGDDSILGPVFGLAKDLEPFIAGSLALYGITAGLGALSTAGAVGGETAAAGVIDTVPDAASVAFDFGPSVAEAPDAASVAFDFGPSTAESSIGIATNSVGASSGSVLSSVFGTAKSALGAIAAVGAVAGSQGGGSGRVAPISPTPGASGGSSGTITTSGGGGTVYVPIPVVSQTADSAAPVAQNVAQSKAPSVAQPVASDGLDTQTLAVLGGVLALAAFVAYSRRK